MKIFPYTNKNINLNKKFYLNNNDMQQNINLKHPSHFYKPKIFLYKNNP